MGKNKKPKPEPPLVRDLDNDDGSDSGPLVFISHDTRDADLAEAFANLLTDASGGILKSFRSSDKSGIAGIEFGSEWYAAIMQKLDDATDVVALLTERSLNRPWILYETGVAKGKLDRTVFGLSLGIPLEKAAVGPFAQFQNSADDEDSITKLVLQLIRRHPDAEPREMAVRRQVQAFIKEVAELLKSRTKQASSQNADSVEVSVAKLFEEIKLQIRDLPELATMVRQLHSKSIETGVQGQHLKSKGQKRVPPDTLRFEVIIGDKPSTIGIARSWQKFLRELGWPSDPTKSQVVFDEIRDWFAQDPDRLQQEGTITISHGSGKTILTADGLVLMNFRGADRSPKI
jgi:hypothetical protein